MKKFFREDHIDYQNYAFGYRHYAIAESPDELESIYEQGFLPYSADVEEDRLIFYLARSLRYDLRSFQMDKKRRYSHRAIEALGVEMQVEAIHDLTGSARNDLRDRTRTWMEARFGTPYLEPQRLEYILRREQLSHIGVIKQKKTIIGYCLLVCFKHAVHYWFAFYNPEITEKNSLGKWMMAQTALWARSTGHHYLYVGTAYGQKSHYKSQGISGIQFFDGTSWNESKSELKAKQENDPD